MSGYHRLCGNKDEITLYVIKYISIHIICAQLSLNYVLYVDLCEYQGVVPCGHYDQK